MCLGDSLVALEVVESTGVEHASAVLYKAGRRERHTATDTMSSARSTTIPIAISMMVRVTGDPFAERDGVTG